MLLPTQQRLALGTVIKYEVRLASGESVLVGAGVVRRQSEQPLGLFVDLSRLSREGRPLIMRMFEIRKKLGLRDDSEGFPIVSDAIPAPHSPAVLSTRYEVEPDVDLPAAMARAYQISSTLTPTDLFDRSLLPLLTSAVVATTRAAVASMPSASSSAQTGAPPIQFTDAPVRVAAVPPELSRTVVAEFATMDNEKTPTDNRAVDEFLENDVSFRTVTTAPALSERLRSVSKPWPRSTNDESMSQHLHREGQNGREAHASDETIELEADELVALEAE